MSTNKNYPKKKNNNLLTGILCTGIGLLAIGGIASLSDGFKNWDMNTWFETSEKEDDDSKTEIAVPSSVFTNGEMDYSVTSMSKINQSNASFVYEDLTLFEDSTVTKIRIPVVSVADCTADAVFTFYVVDVATVETTTTPISTHTLTIKANTYTSNTVNQWVEFDVDIDVKKEQTLAFCKTDDTIHIGYTSGQTAKAAMIFNKVLTSNACTHYGEAVRVLIRIMMDTVWVYLKVKQIY